MNPRSFTTTLMGMGFVVMALLMGVSSAAFAAGTLEVTSPNGGDSWNRGGTYTIEWDKGDAGQFVKIQLLKAGKLYRLISRRTKNDGSHKWKIPSSLKPGVAFKVKIKSISKKTVFDTSNSNFRISKARASTCSKSLFLGCGWEFERSLPLDLKPGAKKHGYRIVSAPNHPVRYGKKSERFMVKPGWCSRNSGWDDCKNDRERSELIQRGYTQREGDEYWYRWSIYLPPTHQNIYETKLAYGQFHQSGCQPVFMFQEYGGGYWLNIQPSIKGYDDNRKLLEANEFVGKWNDIVVHARWTKKKDGWFKVWVNGKKKTSYYGKTMKCKEVYFKYGVYRSYLSRSSKSKTVTTIAYFDGVVRSKSKKGMFDLLLE